MQQYLEPPSLCESVSAKPLSALSDSELEAHIEHCTHLMELAYDRYEQTSCFGDHGEATRWMRLRDDAIRARSPAQVRRMEAARGLARA